MKYKFKNYSYFFQISIISLIMFQNIKFPLLYVTSRSEYCYICISKFIPRKMYVVTNLLGLYSTLFSLVMFKCVSTRRQRGKKCLLFYILHISASLLMKSHVTIDQKFDYTGFNSLCQNQLD
jgi:hypothetical protein